MEKFGLAALLMVSCFALSRAQQLDSLLTNDPFIAEFDSLLSSEDSLSIFQLIDSILQAPEVKDYSQLAMRIGYNGNVVAASRTLGFNQFGLAPGISYYHKSGLYGDVTGYWSPEYSPDYYLTVLSAGYMRVVGKHWSFLAEYSRYVYTQPTGSDVYIPYKNNAGVTNFFELGPVNLRLDYYFYFGDKTAHRILPGISLNLEKRNWHGLKRVTWMPSFNILMGNETVTSYIAETRYYTRPLEVLYRKLHNLPLSYTYYSEQQHKEFGVMNFSLSAPVSVTYKQWTLSVNYTYNFPKPLPGEELGLTNSGYLSFSVARYFRVK